MKLTAVDNQLNVFAVDNFYPSDLLVECMKHTHLLTEYKKEDWQAEYARRRLAVEGGSIYDKMHRYVQSQLGAIENTINQPLLSCDTGFWLDEPGFTMSTHLDNQGVFVSMQIYLTENDLTMPTVFYNKDNSIRFTPTYKVNHGYIMINGPEQFHGCPFVVPPDTFRLSSYTWFYKKV